MANFFIVLWDAVKRSLGLALVMASIGLAAGGAIGNPLLGLAVSIGGAFLVVGRHIGTYLTYYGTFNAAASELAYRAALGEVAAQDETMQKTVKTLENGKIEFEDFALFRDEDPDLAEEIKKED
jgi:hypothetical protein